MPSPSKRTTGIAAALALVLSACAGQNADAEFPPVAKQWYERGEKSFRTGDLEDAELAVENALRAAPGREETRLLAGRVALSRLDYDRAVQVMKGMTSAEARGVRGRALWYKGEVQQAADELESLLSDPNVHDGWAVEIVKLARRGVGRKPFEVKGGLLAVMDMPRTGTASMVVPLEIDGSPALGMIATGTAEAVMDSSAGGDPSWVSLRFGERIEVRDVPVLAKDLSGISKQVNAPIKILIGVNLLRHLRPTIDFAGGQFVVRTFDPPPPPAATTLRLAYARGGGMLVRGAFGTGDSAPACSLLVDTALTFPLALEGAAWTKAGVPPSALQSIQSGGLKQGVLPSLRLGAYEVPRIPGVSSDSAVKEREEGLGVDIDGLLGSGLLATFRVTLIDGGRSMWLEDLPPEALVPPPPINVPDIDIPIEEFEEEAEEEEPAKGKAGTKAAPGKAKAPAAGQPAAGGGKQP
jgi:hypothetical protein